LLQREEPIALQLLGNQGEVQFRIVRTDHFAPVREDLRQPGVGDASEVLHGDLVGVDGFLGC